MSEYDKYFEDRESQHQKERKAERQVKLEKKRAGEAKAKAAAEARSKAAKKYIIYALAALLLIVLVFGRLWLQIRDLSRAKAEAEKNLAELNEKIEDLEDTLERVTSPEYIEQEARSQLRMIYPDEYLYVVEDE